MRKQLVKTVTKLLEDDPRVVLLLGDIGVYGFREAFEKFPERVYNIGILEQASVGVAAGLAIEGMVPIFHTIAPFLVERALEQLKIDFGYQGLGGNFISVGGSYDYAKLGCTHHCPGDVQILKTVPGTQIFIPGHPEEFNSALLREYDNGKLNYFRLSETSNATYHLDGIVKHGKEGFVLAIGPMLDRVLDACKDLDVTIEYSTNAKDAPSDAIVVEPFYKGTLGSPKSIGVPRRFITRYGTVSELDKHCGLTTNQIRERIKGFLYEPNNL